MSWERSGTQTIASPKTIEFQLSAPAAKSVSLCGSFNQWNTNSTRMTKDNRGLWKASLPLKAGKYEYRFFVDGRWTDDPQAKKTVANQFGSKNAVLEVK